MSRIRVQPAGPDRRVPTGRAPGEYFPHGEPTEVERTRHIDRRLADGDLVEAPADGPAPRRPKE